MVTDIIGQQHDPGTYSFSFRFAYSGCALSDGYEQRDYQWVDDKDQQLRHPYTQYPHVIRLSLGGVDHTIFPFCLMPSYAIARPRDRPAR